MPHIEQRVAALEAKHHASLRPRRVFECVVRKGHEAEDRASAFGALGMELSERDLTICFVAVTAKTSGSTCAVRPSARLLAS